MKRMLLIIMVLLLNLTTSVYADHDDHHRFAMDLYDLKLSSSQHHALKEAMKDYKKGFKRYRHQDKKMQQELDALFLSPTFDSAAFEKKYLEKERASIALRTQLFNRLHDILTLEQKRRFIEHIEEWDFE
jgi:Spy/CpxP family protein refolding chaperone